MVGKSGNKKIELEKLGRSKLKIRATAEPKLKPE
jgi:hypothetical protein